MLRTYCPCLYLSQLAVPENSYAMRTSKVSPAPLARIAAVEPVSLGLSVYKNRLPFPLQGYATELSHQWAFPIAR